jgi:hypothetical protein
MNISREKLLIRNEKIKKALTGRTLSPEHRLKLSLAKKGKVGNGLGRTWKMPDGFGENGSRLRKKEWETGIRKGGWKLSEESKKNIAAASTGRPGPWLGKGGELHPNWKGGISKNVHSVSEPKYKNWRMSVFTRDNFQCKVCKTKIGLQAHHILKWVDFVELRYDINNGITLCRAHHPRKVTEEKRLIPIFKELLLV